MMGVVSLGQTGSFFVPCRSFVLKTFPVRAAPVGGAGWLGWNGSEQQHGLRSLVLEIHVLCLGPLFVLQNISPPVNCKPYYPTATVAWT